MKQLKSGPLSGFTVLDFTWVLAGPHASKHLRDLGADVIKVEPFNKGAAERHFQYIVENEGVKQSSYSINNNRGKKSVCLNLKTNQGIDIIHDLIKQSDIIIENFAPGVMDRLKLDYDSVKQIKSDIIYCSISCFGHWGPYSHKTGYDVIAQGASGWIAHTDPHTQAPVSIGDMNSSMHAATAILAALVNKQKTGIGQNIDISMVDCLFSLHENVLPWHFISSAVGKPVDLPKISRHHAGYAPYGVYKGKDGDVVVALLTDLRWPALLDVLGPHGKHLKNDPRFDNLSSRCSGENVKHVHDAVENWVMAQESVRDAERILDEAGIPCMRVRGGKELADDDPHIKAREMVVSVEQPFIGPMKMYGSPMKFSETPAGVRGYAPLLGEHNKEILSEKLGFSEDKIHDLYEKNVLYHEPAVERLPEELMKLEK
jgi:CoA:oxalate CoA-transferase